MAVVGHQPVPDDMGDTARALSDDEDSASNSDTGNIEHLESDFSVGDSTDHPAMVWETGRAPEKGMSSLEATMSLITAIVGAGIMALPQLPKKGGFVPVILLSFAGALAVLEGSGAYVKAHDAWNRTQKAHMITFEEYGVAAAGRCGGLLVRVLQIGWFTGLCSGFTVLMGRICTTMFGYFTYRAWIGCFAPFLWFLCMLRDLTAIAKLVPIGVIGAFGSAAMIIAAGWGAQNTWSDWPEEDIERVHTLGPIGFMPLGSCTATLFGAYCVMGSVPPIISEMRHPKKFPKAFKTAMFTTAVLYTGVIVIGYWGYGNFIHSDITLSLSYTPASATEAFTVPPTQWTGKKQVFAAMVLSFCVLSNLVLSYPLCMMSVFVSIQNLTCAKEGCQPGAMRNYLMRTSLVITTMLIALAVPDFGTLFSVFAAVCGPAQGVFVPILFGAIIRKKVGAKGSSAIRWIYHAFLLAFATFCLVIGFIDSFMSLLKSLGSSE